MIRFAVVVALAVLCTAGCKKNEADASQPPQKPEPKAAGSEQDEPKKEEPAKADEGAKVARGEYLSKLAGCVLCHTMFGPQGPDMDKAWAGGMEVPEVFGTWRSPNITQDKDTGIGGWTDDQIKAAFLEGKRPDGEQLFPVMPYMLYNKMSDEDADALVAYLRTIKPIANKVERATDLKLPKPEVPKPEGKPAPAKTDEVAHGEYIATIMHCVMCHTPMNEQGSDMSLAFAGGMKFELPFLGEGVLYSSNLTPHETGIKDYTDEDIANAIRQMKKKNGSLIMGPMALYQGAWFDLPDDDVKAIAAFLRSLPPTENKVPASTFKPKGPPPGAAK